MPTILKLGGRRRVPAGTLFFHQRGPRSVVAYGAGDADLIVSYLEALGVDDPKILSTKYWIRKVCGPRQQVELYARNAKKGEKRIPGRVQYDWEALLTWCGGTCPKDGECLGQPAQYAGPKNLANAKHYLYCYCTGKHDDA